VLDIMQVLGLAHDAYPEMHTEYCDCVLAALCARYCDCCAMSLWHQVFLVLCIVSQVIVYWVLGYWVLGPYALDTTSKATASLGAGPLYLPSVASAIEVDG